MFRACMANILNDQFASPPTYLTRNQPGLQRCSRSPSRNRVSGNGWKVLKSIWHLDLTTYLHASTSVSATSSDNVVPSITRSWKGAQNLKWCLRNTSIQGERQRPDIKLPSSMFDVDMLQGDQTQNLKHLEKNNILTNLDQGLRNLRSC